MVYLAALPPGQDGLLGNPDGDCWLNVFEYLFGLDAEAADGQNAVTGGMDGGAMTLSFETVAAVTDVEFVVEASETMVPGSWTREGVTLAAQSRSAAGVVMWQARAGGIHAGKTRIFMRIAVKKEPRARSLCRRPCVTSRSKARY